jgi:hypothetical protein
MALSHRPDVFRGGVTLRWWLDPGRVRSWTRGVCAKLLTKIINFKCPERPFGKRVGGRFRCCRPRACCETPRPGASRRRAAMPTIT